MIHGCKNLDKVRACAEIDDCDDWMMVMMASVKACDDVRLLLGLARIVYVCIWCIYNFFGRDITKNMVVCGVYVRFWPTLVICNDG